MLIHPGIDPVAFSLGPVLVRWYGLMYVFAFFAAWGLARLRAARAPWSRQGWTREGVDDMIVCCMIGAPAGAVPDLARRHVLSRRFHWGDARHVVVEPEAAPSLSGGHGFCRPLRGSGPFFRPDRQFHQRRVVGQGHGRAVGHDLSRRRFLAASSFPIV